MKIFFQIYAIIDRSFRLLRKMLEILSALFSSSKTFAHRDCCLAMISNESLLNKSTASSVSRDQPRDLAS